MTRSLTRFTIASTIAACTVLGGCQKKGDVATTDSTAGTGAMASNRTDTTSSAGSVAAPKNDWTDAQILAFTSAANAAEIQEGELARQKATSPAVKHFANTLITDHTQLLHSGRALGKKLGITPDSTKSDVTDLEKSSKDDMKDLNSKKPGKEWDEDFVKKEVDGHQKVLDKLQQASQSAKAPELKDALNQAIAKVQAHLTTAQQLENTVKS